MPRHHPRPAAADGTPVAATPPRSLATTPPPRSASLGDVRTDAVRPAAAQRARTLAEYASSGTLALDGALTDEDQIAPGARAVDQDGTVLLLVPPQTAAAVRCARQDVAAVLHLVDLAPVAVQRRVRAHCRVAGRLTAPAGPSARRAADQLARARQDPAALVNTPVRGALPVRLRVDSVVVDDLWGVERVAADQYATARADPLADHEAELLQHLAAAHHAQLASLCRAAGSPVAPDSAVPLALDHLGLRVRCHDGRRGCDVRFDFERPLSGPDQLGRALHTLLRGRPR